ARVYIVFFFSSRRRHTRSKRDWSSDVCSSDLNLSREVSYAKDQMAGGRRNPVEWLEYLRRATNWKVCPDPGGLGRGSRLKRNQFDDGPNTKAGIDSKVCRRTWEGGQLSPRCGRPFC